MQRKKKRRNKLFKNKPKGILKAENIVAFLEFDELNKQNTLNTLNVCRITLRIRLNFRILLKWQWYHKRIQAICSIVMKWAQLKLKFYCKYSYLQTILNQSTCQMMKNGTSGTFIMKLSQMEERSWLRRNFTVSH